MLTLHIPLEQALGSLPSPRELQNKFPLKAASHRFILQSRETIKDILHGKDSRKLAIIGPCSIHDLESAYDYAEKFAKLAEEVADTLFLVMRVYLEKPRTIRGWKGFLSDPDLDGSHDIAKGLHLSRQLLVDLADQGIPVGSELLELHTAPYLSELISWGCIGARTTQSQPHRELAASLPFPVGFKNTVDGNVMGAIHGILAAKHPHTFLGMDPSGQLTRLESSGNPDCHMVLRGGENRPNYDVKSIQQAVDSSRLAGIHPSLIIDCSHDNCRKKHENQIPVLESVIEQILGGNNWIRGFMLESHLESGVQPLRQPLKHGISITDPCLDFATTQELILSVHKRLNS